VIVPIHCHGNHWTLAVVNMNGRRWRFEYYDSLHEPPGMVLVNLVTEAGLNRTPLAGWDPCLPWASRDTPWAPCLCQRRWIKDEHLEKKKAPLDTSRWTEVVWQRGQSPRQENGYDCGVFMMRTAEYLSRGAELDFKQKHMAYFRRRTVLELLLKSLLP
jgi:Ulp1 family protease